MITTDLIESVTEGNVTGEFPPSQDVFIRLKNGKIIQISPSFNSINVWNNEEDMKNWDLDKAEIFTVDMGGDE